MQHNTTVFSCFMKPVAFGIILGRRFLSLLPLYRTPHTKHITRWTDPRVNSFSCGFHSKSSLPHLSFACIGMFTPIGLVWVISYPAAPWQRHQMYKYLVQLVGGDINLTCWLCNADVTLFVCLFFAYDKILQFIINNNTSNNNNNNKWDEDVLKLNEQF